MGRKNSWWHHMGAFLEFLPGVFQFTNFWSSNIVLIIPSDGWLALLFLPFFWLFCCCRVVACGSSSVSVLFVCVVAFCCVCSLFLFCLFCSFFFAVSRRWSFLGVLGAWFFFLVVGLLFGLRISGPPFVWFNGWIIEISKVPKIFRGPSTTKFFCT